VGMIKLFDMIGTEETIAIAEPTGINYLKIWYNHLVARGIEVRLIDHKTLRIFRQNLGLPNKNDNADALAMAIYGITHQNRPRKFVIIRDEVTLKVRQLALRLQHLNRCQSPLINRCRQYLAYEFPEAANIRSIRQEFNDEPPLLWGWLAGERKSKRYDLLFKKSIGAN
jgi:transposase